MNGNDENFSTRENDTDPFDELTYHWDQLIDEIETLELTPSDPSDWNKRFNRYTNTFFRFHSQQSDYTFLEQDMRIRQIRNSLTVAINKGWTNYRNHERIRLKETYGAFSE